ncbi:universal stress protein [Streptomyces virginiae]|uniref:Universal stress protein n=1 Tax=Streptomyces virginiae TaxID=1961 RepID=A0ABQ3NQZ9_STRVG|nr:universal stress protein [Streptomyces virginiae]MBP2347943.1 nucleotide-binding universal stress UspA family protein [Streptomyces virginiae]GGP93984.1 universal stress protein [Streptomyces virginiae]GHI15152.1 universal stress protein [Streptomyces virginiae]
MEHTVSGSELGSVVVGVDGSEPARQAALWAAGEAERRGRPLHIVYGADTDGRALYASVETIERVRVAGRELLDDIAAAVKKQHPGLVATTEFGRGDPVASLHRAAGRRGTIVVGNRGLGGFTSLMLGSVGLKVAAGAKTPVIIVRGTESGAESGTVLAGVRDERDLDCVRYAAREAELRKAELRLLQVWNVLQSVGDVMTMMDDIKEIADECVRHLTALTEQIRREFPDLTVRADAEKGMSVAGVLVEASRHADLLVMGGRRASAYLGPTLGRHTHSLVHHSHCPVLLIPRHPDEHGSGS